MPETTRELAQRVLAESFKGDDTAAQLEARLATAIGEDRSRLVNESARQIQVWIDRAQALSRFLRLNHRCAYCKRPATTVRFKGRGQAVCGLHRGRGPEHGR